jgi:hypothetical protein
LLLSAFTACRFTRLRLLWVLGAFTLSTTLLSRRRFASVCVHRLSVYAALAVVGSGGFASSTTLLSRRRFASVHVHRLSVYAALATVGSGGFTSSTTLLSRRRFASVRVHRLSVCAALAAVGSGLLKILYLWSSWYFCIYSINPPPPIPPYLVSSPNLFGDSVFAGSRTGCFLPHSLFPSQPVR